MYILANFAAYGLNKYKNFLPYIDNTGVVDLTELKDNCVNIDKEDFDDVMAYTLLHEADPYSAIFTIDINGHYAMFYHEYDDEVCCIENQAGKNEEMFAILDAKYNLTSYALMIEIAPNLWKIVGE